MKYTTEVRQSPYGYPQGHRITFEIHTGHRLLKSVADRTITINPPGMIGNVGIEIILDTDKSTEHVLYYSFYEDGKTPPVSERIRALFDSIMESLNADVQKLKEFEAFVNLFGLHKADVENREGLARLVNRLDPAAKIVGGHEMRIEKLEKELADARAEHMKIVECLDRIVDRQDEVLKRLKNKVDNATRTRKTRRVEKAAPPLSTGVL
jgi:hypothetical protein